MTWQIPWVIAGVDEVPIDIARVFVYASTGGREGVVGIDDLKITQTGSPSGNILTAPGAFVTVSRFQDALYESYVGRNTDSSVQTAVPATTASARTDLVYAHITDPGQAGQPSTAAAVETRVITGVATNVTRLQDVAGFEDQSGYALARITRSAGTSTVTNAQITDLRSLVSPRSIQANRFLNMDQSTTAFWTQLTSTTLVNFPGNANWSVDIPEWAVRVQWSLVADGLKLIGTAGQGISGDARLILGASAPNQIATFITKYDTTLNTGPAERVSIMVADETTIPVGMRGTTQTLRVQMSRNAGPAQMWAAVGQNFWVQMRFVEQAGDF